MSLIKSFDTECANCGCPQSQHSDGDGKCYVHHACRQFIPKVELTTKEPRIQLKANAGQVGGEHYKKYGEFQVWDAWTAWKLNPFQAVILKYIVRYRDKGGVEDLRKAIHYIEKLIEVEEAK